ncbi:hypothetical protein AVEN_186296-1, partial [Araneus ventricosus]
ETHAQDGNKKRTVDPKQYLETTNEITSRNISEKQVGSVNSRFISLTYIRVWNESVKTNRPEITQSFVFTITTHNKTLHIGPNLTEERLRKAEKRMKRGRIHQMLQIIWMHIDCRQHLCTEAASEALRLMCVFQMPI